MISFYIVDLYFPSFRNLKPGNIRKLLETSIADAIGRFFLKNNLISNFLKKQRRRNFQIHRCSLTIILITFKYNKYYLAHELIVIGIRLAALYSLSSILLYFNLKFLHFRLLKLDI